jgi:hypothetical protein
MNVVGHAADSFGNGIESANGTAKISVKSRPPFRRDKRTQMFGPEDNVAMSSTHLSIHARIFFPRPFFYLTQKQRKVFMPSQRNFDFPLSTLLRDAKRLRVSLEDAAFGPPITRRLKIGFLAVFASQITLVEGGGGLQSTAMGSLGQLTQEETLALIEMERLVSGARRSATLAFPQNDVRLHAEFQVGINSPQDLGSLLSRATIISTGCGTHADALAEHGWLVEDSTALIDAVAILEGANQTQENTSDKKVGITATHNRHASALYKMCLTIQNAARLAHPSTKIGQVDGIEEARGRYLLDEFPPRGGASAGEDPDPHGPTPTPPPGP